MIGPLRKLVLTTQPIRCKVKTARDTVARVFPRFTLSFHHNDIFLPSDWLCSNSGLRFTALNQNAPGPFWPVFVTVYFRNCQLARGEGRKRNCRWHICRLRLERSPAVLYHNGFHQTSHWQGNRKSNRLVYGGRGRQVFPWVAWIWGLRPPSCSN